MKIYTYVESVWDDSLQRYVTDESNSKSIEYDGDVVEMKGGGDPPAPDKNIGLAATENIQLGKDWLGFAKEQFAQGQQRQSNLDELTQRVGEQQLATQDKANTRADEQWQQYQDKFQPIENQIASEAMNYDSPERQAQMAAEAKADVARNVDLQAGTQRRNMAAMGLSPTSGRYQGIDRATGLIASLAEAGAENTARNNTRQTGMALRNNAVNVGRNLTGTAAQAYGLGLQSGNSALGNTQNANQNFYANQGLMSSGYGGALSANTSGAGILNNQYQNQMQGWQAQQQANSASSAGIGQGIGQVATIAATYF